MARSILCHEVKGPDAMILVFCMMSFKPAFSLTSFTFIKRLFTSFSLSAIRVVSSAYLRLLIFLPALLIPACALYVSPYKLPWKSAFHYNSQNCIPIIQSQLTGVYTLCLLISRYGQLYEMPIIWLNSFMCHKCKTLSLKLTVSLRCYFAESFQVQFALDSPKGSLSFLKTKFSYKNI